MGTLQTCKDIKILLSLTLESIMPLYGMMIPLPKQTQLEECGDQLKKQFTMVTQMASTNISIKDKVRF